ncbi:MAG: class I mannose-6-phosphate isomerase [Vulcanimicrobiaceae bacterium]
MSALYPLALEAHEREMIWGGHALVERYGKHAAPDATIGESWECFDTNRIENGPFAGRTLADVRAELGAKLTGAADAREPFPLLTKIIDARQPLSVQVHPDDAYARRVEHQPNGKTECWYVLEAEPGATIVLGWNRAISREEYLTRVADGSLGDLLRHVPARAGDVFHLPAGTMHAIGAGIVLFETQQTSDLTYRIFDYNRPGADGKPRELHVAKAADVLDYRAGARGALAPLRYSLDGLERSALVADANFTVERVDVVAEPHPIDLDGMPLVVLALDRAVELATRGGNVRLEPYRSAVVPAGLESVRCSASDGRAALLTAAPPHDRHVLERRFGRAGVPVEASATFLAQFA